MVDTNFALVCSLIILQLYICACTYWMFRKFDRYENFAFGIIERYLSRRTYNVSSDNTSDVVPISRHIANIPERNKILNYIAYINSYAPQRVQIGVNNIINKWYSQLSIDILALCMLQESNRVE